MALPATDSPSIERPTGQISSNNVFAAFDDRLVAGTRGAVVVRASSAFAAMAVFGHATRRLSEIGVSVLGTQIDSPAPFWRQVAEQLGLSDLPSDPTRFAGVVSQAVSGRDLAVVAHLPRAGSWDRAVTRAIVEDICLTLVLVSDGIDVGAELSPSAYELAGTLSVEDKRRWWDAVGASAAAHVAAEDLVRLDDWWSVARYIRPPHQRDLPPIAPLAGALLGSLAVAGRSWPRADLGLMGGGGDELGALLSVGAVALSRGWVSIEPRWRDRAEIEASACPSQFRVEIAHAVQRRFPSDPSAHAQAASILVAARRVEDAERAHERALDLADDPLSHGEVVGQWERAVEVLPPDVLEPIAVRSCGRALSRGDAGGAVRWAQLVLSLTPNALSSLMLVGRALMNVGDTTTARSVFERAMAVATTEADRASVAAEFAELRFLAGDIEAAVEDAERAMEGGADAEAARLDGRNVIGKVLLAQSRWAEADSHFAADAFAAAAARLLEKELRARINRAIALLRRDLVDEARSVLEAVRHDAQTPGLLRAEAFAVENLAIVSLRQKDYAGALHLHEVSVNQLRKFGDRPTMALRVCNLAASRCSLGLFDLADEALSFARRLAGPSAQPGRAGRCSQVAARIALDRGHFLEAARMASRAILDAEAAGILRWVTDAQLMSARALLASGDTLGAKQQLAQVHADALDPDNAAEFELVSVGIACATGELPSDAMDDSLSRAGAALDPPLIVETYCLAAKQAISDGQKERASRYIDRAVAVRGQVARSLPLDLRVAFLARREMVTLEQLLLGPPVAVPVDPPSKGVLNGRRGRAADRELVGDDPAVRTLRAAIVRVAPSDTTVLIHGESGTGKELVAEAIHRASRRRDASLVSVNCSALVDTLLLSELFGHEKGAFTGASARRRGRFEVAEGGTLFLDEIGDISARAQVALLRVLQEKSFERVGGTVTLRANVRVVCATHRDLRAMVERGEFREDLYYRLRGVTLEIPPLRARMADIPRISRHLLEVIANERGEGTKTLSEDACVLLTRHRWPGNIRELDNALRAASLFADGDCITARHIVENVTDLRNAGDPIAASRGALDSSPPPSRPSGEYALSSSSPDVTAGAADSVDLAYAHVRQGHSSLSDLKRQIERDCIARALGECGGNITKAATLLGMKRPRLSQLVKHYGMSVVNSEELT